MQGISLVQDIIEIKASLWALSPSSTFGQPDQDFAA
jgi:hypothetical protein